MANLPSLNMQKKSGQIVLYLEIFNFKTFKAEILFIYFQWILLSVTAVSEILQIFELLIWKIDDFINSFCLNLTFKCSKNESQQKC